MKKLYWKIFIICLSIKWIFGFNIGDIVVYKNKKYKLASAKRYGGKRGAFWNMYKTTNSNERINDISQYEFKKEINIRNYVNSFKAGYNFYMLYWFDIWVNEGIKDWMKACRIWGD